MKYFGIGLLIIAGLLGQNSAIKMTQHGPAYQDGFMEKVISQYSTLEKGIHKISKDKAKSLAFKVLTLDAGMKDGQANGVIGDNFEKIWAHYDVLAEDKIDSDLVVPMLHMLAHDDKLQFSIDAPAPTTCEKYGYADSVCKTAGISF